MKKLPLWGATLFVAIIVLGCIVVLWIWSQRRREITIQTPNHMVDEYPLDFLQSGGTRNKCYDCEESGVIRGYQSKCYDCSTHVTQNTRSIQYLQETPGSVPKLGYVM